MKLFGTIFCSSACERVIFVFFEDRIKKCEFFKKIFRNVVNLFKKSSNKRGII